jgi:hypothetical protein
VDFVQMALMPLIMAGSAQELPGVAERTEWKSLHKGEVAVVCGPFAEAMWCHAEAVLPGPRSEVQALLADVEGIAELFPRMRSMTQVDAGVMHQVIDYPFPYDDRDIVASFSWQRTANADALMWASVGEPAVPTVGVRLDGAAGRFELRDGPRAGTTALAYTWRGELGPGLPDWVRPYAWRAQADEVVEGLSRGLHAGISTD